MAQEVGQEVAPAILCPEMEVGDEDGAVAVGQAALVGDDVHPVHTC